jgi:hypothetical protein
MRLGRGSLALCLALLASCSGKHEAAASSAQSPPSQPQAPSKPASSARPVQIEMRNVHLHVDEGIVLAIERLRGEMVSRSEGRPPVFDDPKSYVLNVSSAEMSMDMESLSSLMNRHVFNYKDAPMSDITVKATDDGRLEQSGKLHKGVVVPFSMKASVSATPDGRLKLHTDSIKAAGVPVKGLLGFFGLKVEDLADLERRRGLSASDNDIMIAVGQVLPPPEIRGRLSKVAVVGGRLMQTFAPAHGKKDAALRPPDPRARNYVYFGGGVITFGKLTMSDADLQLIDADMKDAFDFFPTQYNKQLVAGYSKNTPTGGLKTYMPDFADLTRRRIELKPEK